MGNRPTRRATTAPGADQSHQGALITSIPGELILLPAMKRKTKLDQIWSNLSKDDREEVLSHATRLAAYTDPAQKRYGGRRDDESKKCDPNPFDPDDSNNIPSYSEIAGFDPTER